MSPTSCFWTKPASPPICFGGYGRAPRGARVHDHAPCGRWQTSTFLAALRVTGLTAPGVFGRRDRWRELPRLHRTDPGADPAARRHRHCRHISGPTRSPAANAPSRPPGPPSGTCHPTARTSIPSSSASRSSRPSFAPLAVAAPRRSGRSSASAWRTSALTNAATIFGTAGTRPPHGHEKRFRRSFSPGSRGSRVLPVHRYGPGCWVSHDTRSKITIGRGFAARRVWRISMATRTCVGPRLPSSRRSSIARAPRTRQDG